MVAEAVFSVLGGANCSLRGARSDHVDWFPSNIRESGAQSDEAAH